MVVGKITFTSLDANSRLQQKQQDINIAFAGTLKPNISKSLLNGTAQAGEKGAGTHENNLYRKAVKGMKNLFKIAKQAITGSEPPKPLELGIPHKVDWTDFASIEGELTKEGTKVIKNKDGKVVKQIYSANNKTVHSVYDYDQKTGKIVKLTNFNKDGKTVSHVSDYDPITGKEVKLTSFNKDGKTVDFVSDHNPITGNQVKLTIFNEDGKAVKYVLDYDPITGKEVKSTIFNKDGTIKKVSRCVVLTHRKW